MPDRLTPTDAASLRPPEAALLRSAARRVHLVAERCADPEQVAAVAGAGTNQHPVYEVPPWDPVSLAYGWPGTAVLYGQLARYDPRWRSVAHQHLTAAVRALASGPGAHGVWRGPAAVLLAAETCAMHDDDYRSLRARLISRLAADELRRSSAASDGPGVPWDAYDVISGPAGTARVLLDAVDERSAATLDGTAVARARQALTAVLTRLVRITEPIRVAGVTVPGWWVPPELQPDAERADHPRGHFNLGLAHGVAGPLALLALATERGHVVPGQEEAIRTIARWLCRWAGADEAGPYWPAMVGWDEATDPGRRTVTAARSAWCYGAPGIAAALYRAGAVLDEPDWRELAVRALCGVVTRSERDWRLTGPGLCHGFAGLLTVLTRVADAEDDPGLRAGALRVAGRVLDHADESEPFVFPDTVPVPGAQSEPVRVRVAGLLEGAAGVACALTSVIAPAELAPAGQVRPTDRPWYRALLLG